MKENERLKVAATLAVKDKKEATSQALAEIKKHDLHQARFTCLEGEYFDLTKKLERLQLVHNQMTKKVGELENKVKSTEKALPQQTYRDINPSIVANYEDFIQDYPEEWFAHLDLSAL
ncbi:hypothetical protein LIER_02031 [Lithospermum erythrorhizon]|uniref:Uncharacterized protein n=1 Tax=Lithospermum erythrorhizon TaxID=34254 RepID=A0AAV3NRQ4_LITER